MAALVLYLLLQFGIIVSPNDLTKEDSLPLTIQTNEGDGIGGTWDDEG